MLSNYRICLALVHILVVSCGRGEVSDHFYVEGRNLHDRCGEPVALRGVNKMVVWNAEECRRPGAHPYYRTPRRDG